MSLAEVRAQAIGYWARQAHVKSSYQRRALIALQARIDLREAAIVISIGADKITLASKLVKRGNDVRLVIAGHRATSPDPILCKLVAQAFAARDYLVTGALHPCHSRIFPALPQRPCAHKLARALHDQRHS